MGKKSTKEEGSKSRGGALGCCSYKVESLISVDARGQIVLPKDLREKMGIRAGDKYAVLTCEMNGKVSCLSFIRVEDLTGMVKSLLGPVMSELVK